MRVSRGRWVSASASTVGGDWSFGYGCCPGGGGGGGGGGLPAASVTVTVPVIVLGWTLQTNEYVPGDANVYETGGGVAWIGVDRLPFAPPGATVCARLVPPHVPGEGSP